MYALLLGPSSVQAILDAFWTVVGELSAEERRRLLQFWTGLAHLPAGGFKSLGQQLQLVPARSMEQEEQEQEEGQGQGQQQEQEQEQGQQQEQEQGQQQGQEEQQELHEQQQQRDQHGQDQQQQQQQSEVLQLPGSVTVNFDVSPAHSDYIIDYVPDPSAMVVMEAARVAAAIAAGRAGGGGTAPQPPNPSPPPGPVPAPAPAPAPGPATAPAAAPAPMLPLLLSAHTCFFQLRLPLTWDVGAMRGAVAESLANLGSFWNEWEEE